MSTPRTTSPQAGGPVLVEEMLRCLVVMLVRLPRGDVLGGWHLPGRVV
ncbi:hypothetical protein [Streptomyces sp. WAC00263]|nr:hypothetical protein [Streptomyces sp. WAC00263]